MELTMKCKITKTICGKTVSLYGDSEASESIPVVYLMLYSGRGEEVWDACHALGCPPFTLAAIGDVDWNNDMTPWPHNPVFKGDDGYKGGAPQFLDLLINNVIPYVESVVGDKPAAAILAGYSLGGLFSAWSLFQKTPFTGFISASGSLWFPDFLSYATNTRSTNNCFVYLSLGDKEEISKNKVLSTVGDCTKKFYELLKERNVPCMYEMNKGNHFVEADLRTAKGIIATLGQVQNGTSV
jgi:predicted alpha/beta superfamily hydrolase